jgi:large subunit ribosomal protein L13
MMESTDFIFLQIYGKSLPKGSVFATTARRRFKVKKKELSAPISAYNPATFLPFPGWNTNFLENTVDKRDKVSFRTYSAKDSDVKKDWYIVDAEGKTVGRLATEVARVLRGKHKTMFTPHVDTGDFVVVINAGKVKLTGKRESQKEYFRSTLYPGGARFEKFGELISTRPERVIEYAVKGMLPKNSLGRKVGMKLKIYAGAEHPHAAQQPKTLSI